MSTRLILSRDQRAGLFAGDCPAIYGPVKVVERDENGDVRRIRWRDKECPVEPGDVVELSKNVSLRILHVRNKRGGGWTLHYELRDKRDPVRNLRRTPPVVVPRGDDHPTAEAIKQAAQESAYTSGYTPLADSGEAVDEQTQRRFDRETEDSFKAHLDRERREQKARRLDERLRNLEIVAREKGVDVSGHMAAVERRIESAERKVGRDAA